MRIKKLELVGFKSFKDRTVIQFDAGITGVVGPNGCGKSNIIDALLWVMGEQSAKHLRGSSMEDVIFGGAENYAPAGMAEVSLTLENDGGPFPAKYMNHSEVQLTRKLFRSGESEYLINREAARLKDIQEVFMDTGAGSKGFSIVEQGAIGKIITAKPEDRRTLIEEAAGITKFKVRKRESQKKLELTDQNLIRINDIVGELKRQIDSLQRQAKRAERYRELKIRAEQLDIWLATLKYKELHSSFEDAQKQFTDAEMGEISGRAELERLEAVVQDMQLQVLEKETAVQDVAQRFSAAQSVAQKKESELQNLKFEVEQAKRNAQMQGTMRSEIQARQDVLSRQKQEIAGRLDEVRALAESLREEFETKNEEFQSIQQRINEIDEDLTRERRELMATAQGEGQLQVQIESIETRLSETEERFESANMILTELKTKESEFNDRKFKLSDELEKEKQLQLDIMNDVENFAANREELQKQFTEKQGEVEQFKDQLNAVASRLYGLENLQANFEGFEEGVKNVMLWSKKRREELGPDGSVVGFQPVSEVIEVKPEFELAMEAALGGRLQLLLSTNNQEPLQAVEYLKSSKSGRSGFLLSSDGAARGGQQPSGDGVVGILSDAVTAPTEHQATVARLLGGVAVVDSLMRAIELRREFPEWTFVTPEGDTLTSEGILTGGVSDQVDSGLLKRRREIKELSQQKDEWAGKLSLAQLSLKKIQERLETVQKDFENAQRQKVERDVTMAEKRKDLERAENEVANLKQALTRQEREVNQLQEQRVSQEAKLVDYRTHLQALETKKLELEESTQSLSVELAQVKQGVDELRSRVTHLQVESAMKKQESEGLGQQNDLLDRQLAEIESQFSRMTDESEKNSESLTLNSVLLEETRAELDRTIADVETLSQHLARLRNEYEEIAAQEREHHQTVSELRRRQNDLKAIMNEMKLKSEQAQMKESYLLDQIHERYMVRIPEVLEKYENFDGDQDTAGAELEDLKEKIKKIGEVNLSAIEEYEEVSRRYEFLSQQQNDLVESKDHLRKVIDRINRICSKRFKETFEAVNERFEKVFPVLFGGGEAKLILIEDPEKDEMGIDIVARPPGKKPQSVTLLSGGEKALTAVSLIFSIFLVKPSPFCLLDEVDAPLDDANVSRFNDLVREMAKRSQIIVITHNKATMEINEKLYGVTMQEKGVSKMVSVDLQQAREVVGV